MKLSELGRHFLHMFTGLVLIILIQAKIINLAYILVILAISIILSILSRKIDVPIIKWFLDSFERDSYKKTFPGKGFIFFFIGVSLSLFLFKQDIALASIAILTFGDAPTSIFGQLIGQRKYQHNRLKTVEGTIVGILFGFIAALFFVNIIQAAFASVLAMLAESIEFKFSKRKIDDNIVVPLIAGLTILLVRIFF